MKCIDFKNEFDKYLNDENRKISEEQLNNICRIYQKEKTCRYIFLSSIGHVCIKRTSLKKEIDRLADNGKMTGNSDNCVGLRPRWI